MREPEGRTGGRIDGYDRKIREIYRNSEIRERLGEIEGIGPVTATALVAAVGDRSSQERAQFASPSRDDPGRLMITPMLTLLTFSHDRGSQVPHK
jgi:transposase